MLSFQPGLQRQDLEVEDNLVVPRIELVRLRIECGIVMHRSEVRDYHPSFGYYQFPFDMNILKRFLKCCSGNIAQPQGLCDHILCEARGFALFPCQPLSRLFQLNHILMLFPDFNEDMGILPNILHSEDHGISNSVVACKQETCQKILSLSMQHLFHVLWTVFTDGLYELVVDVILDWP
jgi:hypothetical protein